MRQANLFESSPFASVAPAGNVRQTVIDATVEKANAEWRERYERFILLYLEVNGAASGEEIRLAYEAQNLPQPESKRASGGIYQALRKQGRIKVVDMELSKIYGNPIRKYIRLK